MNILVTINKNYLKQLQCLLYSIQKSNKDESFNIFVLNQDLSNNDIKNIEKVLDTKKFSITDIKMKSDDVEKLPTFNGRYPVEIYFRLFAAKYLPKETDRVLYLDTDIIVINKLKELYNMDFEDNYFIATTNVKEVFTKINEVRLGLAKDSPYINTGVLLMNLKKIRSETNYENDVLDFIQKNKKILMLPDQDIISMMYGNKTKIIDSMKYNLGDRAFNLYNINNPQEKIDIEWVKNNAVIIHYYSKNKPYSKNYVGKLGCFYYDIEKELEKIF